MRVASHQTNAINAATVAEMAPRRESAAALQGFSGQRIGHGTQKLRGRGRHQRKTQGGKEPQQYGARGVDAQGEQHPSTRLMAGGQAVVARAAQKNNAKSARDAQGRHGADKGQRRGRQDERQLGPDVVGIAGEQPRVDQELAGKAVEWRQRRNGHAAHQKTHGGDRHQLEQAAQPLDVNHMLDLIDAAGGVKQLTFEKCMVEHMQQAAAKAQCHQGGAVPAQAQATDAKTDAGNANVLGG